MTRHERIQKEIISANKELGNLHCSGIQDSKTAHTLSSKPLVANANDNKIKHRSNKLKV